KTIYMRSSQCLFIDFSLRSRKTMRYPYFPSISIVENAKDCRSYKQSINKRVMPRGNVRIRFVQFVGQDLDSQRDGEVIKIGPSLGKRVTYRENLVDGFDRE